VIKKYKNKKILVVIPARLKSTRLLKKLLRKIHGIPMVIRAAKKAESVGVGEVIVAADSKTILNVCDNFKINSIRTSINHKSGSDRVHEAYTKIKENFDLVVNLQGDLPLFRDELLLKTIDTFNDKSTEIATAVCELKENELKDLNVVKSIVKWSSDGVGRALDFVRKSTKGKLFHHIGIYVYTPKVLQKFVNLRQTRNEIIRKLEQMRALDNSITINVAKVKHNPPSVDTLDDLKKIRKIIKNKL
tara:strand:+ start:505 stop:1242 length:738 start_codon:yes stop_codon:yes gene_type:complete